MKQTIKNLSLLAIASFFIAAGWNWAYTTRQPHWKFIITANIHWLGIFLGFILLMFIYKKITKNKHTYWTEFFYHKLPILFLILSTYFFVLFSKSELASIIWTFLVSIGLFYFLQKNFQKHPTEKSWSLANKSIFIWGLSLLAIFTLIQYTAYKYYILESKGLTHLVILSRAVAITLIYLTGLVWSQTFFIKKQGFKKIIPIIIWISIFVITLFFWMANLEILMASGLYVSPIAMEHASGATDVIWNKITYVLITILVLFISIVIFLITKLIKNHQNTSIKTWRYLGYSLLSFSVLIITLVTPIKNTPEFVIFSNFYDFYFNKEKQIEISPTILDKLKKQFGLNYNAQEFSVNHRAKIFNQTQKLLPEKFYQKSPNIVIIFVESLL